MMNTNDDPTVSASVPTAGPVPGEPPAGDPNIPYQVKEVAEEPTPSPMMPEPRLEPTLNDVMDTLKRMEEALARIEAKGGSL